MRPYYQYSNGVKISPPASGPLVTFGGRYLYKPTQSSGVITDDDLSDAVFWNNRVNGMPINDNGIYLIMFYGNLTLKYSDGDKYLVAWPNDYCGYHLVYASGGLDAKVGIIGDPATAVPRNFPCLTMENNPPNKDISADNFMSVYTHELIEIATNPFGMCNLIPFS